MWKLMLAHLSLLKSCKNNFCSSLLDWVNAWYFDRTQNFDMLKHMWCLLLNLVFSMQKNAENLDTTMTAKTLRLQKGRVMYAANALLRGELFLYVICLFSWNYYFWGVLITISNSTKWLLVLRHVAIFAYLIHTVWCCC